MRLRSQPGERIDRDHPIRFRYGGKELSGFAGDTIGSALYAAGRRIFSRSFKYHRPRGLLCCAGHCPNCMMTVDGVPNVRVCVEPLEPDVDVRDQNVRGSADRDLLGVVDKVGGPFTPVGFYYRTMIRPRRLWPLYEKVLRNVAGLGRVDETANGHGHYETVHRRVDVLVIGGGPAGRAAAEAAEGDVLLVDDRESHEASYEVLAPATALAIYEGGLVPVAEGNVLHRVRAGRIVVATGALEQPLLFSGNDLVGVMLPAAVRRMVDDWALRPGERAVLVGEGALGVKEQLARAGVEIAATSLEPTSLSAHGRRGRLRWVELDGIRFDCDLLVVSGGLQPAYSLLAQAGARIEYEPRRGIFVPTELPAGVEVVGAAAGEIEQSPAPGVLDGHGDKCFVCICEDVTTKDVKRALCEGFDSIELAKRYTTVTMGPCQGKLCQLASTRLLARETDTDESAIGTTTARPPWRPVELGLLAGPRHEPAKLTPLHSRHEALGAEVIWTGAWRRAFHYGNPAAEVRAVHESLGVIDVSTLGKVIVEGPGAAELLDRLYPNRFSDLRAGRIRYGVLTSDGGRIMDDGTVARLDDELFYVTTTSTGSEGVVEWFEWWNAIWGYDVEIVNVTGALAAMNLAGPRAREALSALTDADLSNESFRYLDAKEISVAGAPCLGLRIGFVGELGYELHCPATEAGRLWDALVAAGAAPFGLEAQRVLRLEKGHVIVGQDTDSESNLLSARMGWTIKDDKPDYVGKPAVPHLAVREQLVGFTADLLPPEGAQIVRDGRIAGRVTSSRVSERVGSVVGLAWVDPDCAEDGVTISIRVDGMLHSAAVTLAPFYDPEGALLRS
ncbi:MAG TPA: 2Fe-2S iron-sulfur cluster-binding protein [Gaiellaceae bacterium]|nr:2Fe-2S iron-sulfur cluster-binding protein [Gaiellaceae bacterium]